MNRRNFAWFGGLMVAASAVVAQPVFTDAEAISRASSALPPPGPAPAGAVRSNLDRPDFSRAIIADALGSTLKSEASVQKMIADVRAAGFNTVIVQVRAHGDALYNSQLAPKAAGVEPGFDPLKSIIAAANTGPQPLKVIAMITTHRVWQKRLGEPAPDHIARKQSQWLSQRADGSTDLGDDKTETWLDPGVPAVQEHVASIAAEVAKNYSVHGILIDRLRYPETSNLAGYNPAAVAAFQAETGSTGNPAATDEKWNTWRRAQVTKNLERIRSAVKAARPEVMVAVNAITFGNGPRSVAEFQSSDSYAKSHADWLGWSQAGLVDATLLLNYKNALNGAESFHSWSEFALANKGKARIIVGIGGWLNPANYTTAMMTETIFDPRADGLAVSSYNEPVNDRSQREATLKTFQGILDANLMGRKAAAYATVSRTSTGLSRLNEISAAVLAPSFNGDATVPAPTQDTASFLGGAPDGNSPAAGMLPPLTTASPTPIPTANESASPSLPSLGAAMPPLPGETLSPSSPVSPLPPAFPLGGPGETQTPAQPAGTIIPLTPGNAARSGNLSEALAPANPNAGMLGSTSNFDGAPVSGGDASAAAKFVAPRVVPESTPAVAEGPLGLAPTNLPKNPERFVEYKTPKKDYGDPDSIFVPKDQDKRGLKEYAPGVARTPLNPEANQPPTGPFETITLSNGRQFTGKVVDRNPSGWTIEMPSGGRIVLPASRIRQ